MNEKHMDVCEALGWKVCEDGGEVELEQSSPAGEDFVFYVESLDFVNKVKTYALEFDTEEHIEMWIEAKKNGVRGVPSIRRLVEDADDIQKMLNALATALTEVR